MVERGEGIVEPEVWLEAHREALWAAVQIRAGSGDRARMAEADAAETFLRHAPLVRPERWDVLLHSVARDATDRIGLSDRWQLEEYWRMLVSVLQSQGISPEDAKDGANWALLQLTDGRCRHDEEHIRRAWLVVVAKNWIRDEFRRQRRVDELPGHDHDADLGSTDLPLEEKGELAERSCALRAAVERLGGNQQIVMETNLAFGGDLGNKEIALILGMRPGTVKKHVDRARAKLRKDRSLREVLGLDYSG